MQQHVRLQSAEKLNYRFSEYSFFREFWSNEELKPLLIEVMPDWLGSQIAKGQPLGDKNIEDCSSSEDRRCPS